jgi:hypothetical protein
MLILLDRTSRAIGEAGGDALHAATKTLVLGQVSARSKSHSLELIHEHLVLTNKALELRSGVHVVRGNAVLRYEPRSV